VHAHVRHSAQGRYAKQWSAVGFAPAAPATPVAEHSGTAGGQSRGAALLSDERPASTWLAVGSNPNTANQRELEALSELRRQDWRSVDSAALQDITTCVRTLSVERAAARDRLTGLVVIETLDSLREAQGTHSIQRLAALLEATRPDRLECVVVLTPPMEQGIAAAVGALSGWLQSYARCHLATRIGLLDGAVDEQGQIRAGMGRELASWCEAQDRGLGRVDELRYESREANTLEATNRSESSATRAALALAPQTEWMTAGAGATHSKGHVSSATHEGGALGADVVARTRFQLDPVGDPFLAEHRFRQRPLLPLDGMIECFLESAVDARQMSRDLPYTIFDLRIGHGLKFLSDEAKTVEVCWRQTARGLEGELTTEFRDSRGRLLNARRNIASVTLGGPPAAPALLGDLGIESDAPWRTFVYPDADSIIFHGPTYRWVESVQLRGKQMLSRVISRCPREIGGTRQGDWLISLALADVALYACGSMWFAQNPSSVTIPQGIDRWTLFQPVVAGQRYQTLVGYRDRSATEVSFDSVVVDEQGKVVLAIEGYRATLVATGKGE
ncbi:MAG: polyketide synthase dehydratase domain-containing protein, partial [Planctomycetota bacterium]